MPRPVRRAAHPVRTVKRPATPKIVKKLQRATHPVDIAIYSVERSISTTLRHGITVPAKKTRSPRLLTQHDRGWAIRTVSALTPGAVVDLYYELNGESSGNDNMAQSVFGPSMG